MPTVQCPSCGKVVRFEGVAGVCPNCAAVVQARKPPPPVEKAAKAEPPKSSRPRAGGASPPDLESIQDGGEEVFEPTASLHDSIHAGPFAGLDKRLVYGIGAALGVLLLFGLYIALRTPTPDVVIPPASPLANKTPANPEPDDSSTPQPVQHVAPQPIPAPIVVPAVSKPAWMSLKPIAPKLAAPPITDKLVEKSIKLAVAYLKAQFNGSQLKDPQPTKDDYTGGDALAVYALLHAGEAIDDSELSISNPFMQGLLDQLKKYEMSGDCATYCRALRASALAMNNRDVDATQLGKDRQYLLESEVSGAYQYYKPPKGATLDSLNWDHSNSQYGVLGIWANVQAGIPAPDKYWNDVEQHWLHYQAKDGTWGYKGGDSDSLTMTCAGVTTLCVTAEQLELIASKGKHDAHPQMSEAIEKALGWLAKGDNVVNFSGWKGYSLYGVERMALATGYRYFGDHDWYRELGAREIKEQHDDGGWDSAVETSFRILFLSRGRQPILLNKLRFDGDWNDRPRDAAKLTQFASAQLEKPFAWGVAELSRNWWDWMESPYLFITTDAAPSFSDQDCHKLRAYTDAGGMIFFHNEFGSSDVDDFVNDLAKRVYPEYQLRPVAPDDLVYSTVFPMKTKPPLKSVGNGTRTFMVYSPKDITQDWVRYRAKDSVKDRSGLQLGLNLFVDTAGKSDFRNRLNSPYEEAPDFDPIGTVRVAQVRYTGPWNPEPKAYERFSRWFQKQTSIKLDVQPVNMLNLSPNQTPVAVMTGNAAVDFSKMDLHVLHEYVANGGVLLIDSTGGNKAFAESIRQSLLPAAFAEAQPTGIPGDHPILAGNGDCMDPLPKARLRNFASMQLNGVAPAVQYATLGKGTIVISDLDVTTGLLDSGTYGILGYTPAYSQSLVKNVILWALSRYH